MCSSVSGPIRNPNFLFSCLDDEESEPGIKQKIVLSFCDDDGSVVDMELTSAKHSEFLNIVGHSHGLVCLSDARRDVYLCNPNIKQFRLLPPSILLNEFSDPIALGFGYDSKSNDFKVVRVVHFEDPPHHYHPSKVEIYDLSTDQWREINTPVPGYFVLDEVFEISYNGVYYSSALDKNYKSIFILFDMSDELFSAIPAPDDFSILFSFLESPCEKPDRKFMVWNGSIVLFICPWIGDEKPYDMWVMDKDESGAISWSKRLTISPDSAIRYPIMFLNSDELLMNYVDDMAYSYNINTKEFKQIPIKSELADCFFYEKSLLSVEGGSRLDLGVVAELPLN